MRPELIQVTELLQKNTPESIEQAIGLLQRTVYSFSMKVCGHQEDAEDTMQEVLYRSLGHLTKLQEPQALAVWLYTVTRNRCWRMRRKPAGAPAQTLSLDELMPDEAELGRLLADAAANPENEALHAERSELLHQAVLGLPPSLRMVLVLHDMEDLTTEQVALILNLKPGTVRVRLHRARLAARKLIHQASEGSPAQRETKPQNVAKKRSAACEEIFANLSEYLDGRVEPLTCEQMREHIENCPACVAFLRDLRAAIDRCRTLEVPCDLAVAQRLRTALTREYLRLIGLAAEQKLKEP